ncbi:hypothetical protein HJFPF1_01829 [Paramyrothecium foliicola]|nr:hypothetical protein HJFPF1_01829 [Paramyrothecium foliicola]
MSITAFAGPFPTEWVSPPQCTSFVSEAVIVLDAASSCLPKDFDTDTAVYYSPGTACPSGYTAQDYCSKSNDATTTVTCCPVRESMTMWCVEDANALRPPWVDYQCTWSAGNTVTEVVVTSSSRHETYSATITMSGADGVNAYGIRMVYEASDISKSTSTSSPSRKSVQSTATSSASSSSESDVVFQLAEPSADTSSNSPGESTTNSSSNPAAATSDSGSASNGGLSTGAIAAIGVVVPLSVIAILVGAFLLFRRRRKQQVQDAPSYGAVIGGSSDEDVPKPMPLYGGAPLGPELYGCHDAKELPVVAFNISELPAETPQPGTVWLPGENYSIASSYTNLPGGPYANHR